MLFEMIMPTKNKKTGEPGVNLDSPVFISRNRAVRCRKLQPPVYAEMRNSFLDLLVSLASYV